MVIPHHLIMFSRFIVALLQLYQNKRRCEVDNGWSTYNCTYIVMYPPILSNERQATPPIIYFIYTPSFVVDIQKCYDKSTEQYKMVSSYISMQLASQLVIFHIIATDGFTQAAHIASGLSYSFIIQLRSLMYSFLHALVTLVNCAGPLYNTAYIYTATSYIYMSDSTERTAPCSFLQLVAIQLHASNYSYIASYSYIAIGISQIIYVHVPNTVSSIRKVLPIRALCD